jgi:hypothetical protein
MKKLLLSIVALAVASAPLFGEDQDQQKQSKNRNQPAPKRQVNTVPKSYTPRVQQHQQKTQALQNKPNVTNRTYTPRTNTSNVQNRPRTVTPRDRDAAVNANTKLTNQYNQSRNRNRTNPNLVRKQTPDTTVQSNTNTNTAVRNRDWQNRTTPSRNWQNRTRTNTFTYQQARNRFHRQHHDRSWWRSHYSHISLFAGGYYYWDDGYWFPAYGYDPAYSTYAYDEPIYGYSNLAPGQVISNVQAALREQGYYNDNIDGLIGPNTRAALRNFQRNNNLPITAAIDGPTLQALGLS